MTSRRRLRTLAARKRNGTCSPDEKEQRLIRVQNLYLDGTSYRDIQTTCAAEFTCTDRTIRNYIAEVKADMRAEEGEVDAPLERSKARARLEALYLEAKGDVTARVRIVKLAMDMLPGGMAPQQMQVTGAEGGPVKVESDSLNSRIAAILAKAKD